MKTACCSKWFPTRTENAIRNPISFSDSAWNSTSHISRFFKYSWSFHVKSSCHRVQANPLKTRFFLFWCQNMQCYSLQILEIRQISSQPLKSISLSVCLSVCLFVSQSVCHSQVIYSWATRRFLLNIWLCHIFFVLPFVVVVFVFVFVSCNAKLQWLWSLITFQVLLRLL